VSFSECRVFLLRSCLGLIMICSVGTFCDSAMSTRASRMSRIFVIMFL